MRECPFCGAIEPALQIALIRVVCLGCGASGPMAQDAEAAWDVRYSDFEEAEKAAEETEFMGQLASAFHKSRVTTPIMSGFSVLRLDGSAESVRSALHEIFGRDT